MKSRITKLTAAAALIIALYIFLQFPSGAAYALQDTIEAYNSIRWLHIRESRTVSQEARTTDIWLGCDEEGNITRMRFQADNVGEPVGSLIIAGDSDRSEAWLARHNLLMTGYGDSSVLLGYDVSELDPKFLFERLFEQERRGEAIFDVNEPKDKTDLIIVTVTYPQSSRSENWKKVFYIDQTTNLIKKIDKFELKGKEFQNFKTIEFFDYNQPIDQKMFTLDGDVSADARVVDLSEVDIGMLQGDMTDEEIAVEITRQFFEAMFAKDFHRAGQLYLGAPDFLVEQALMGANIIEVISVGPAYPDPDPDSNAMMSSCKFLAEFEGQYYEVNAMMLRVIRGDKDTNCWLISGLRSFSIRPASGTLTLSRNGTDLSPAIYNGLTPGEFMRKWLVLGPLSYPVRDGTYFASPEGQKVAFDTDSLDFLNFTPKVKIDNTDYEWTTMESKYSIVDLNQLVEEKTDFNVAYLWARIEMPQDTIGILGIGSNDGVKVWLNGELVHENWLYRNVVSDNDRVPVTFRKGTNQLVLKVQNAMGPWGFSCRLLPE
ncbi:MAG: hypothetical protein GY774_03060 [Planctomycetes bacterium]|nr:hypothetical protein [Planctomycetota bacterium]